MKLKRKEKIFLTIVLAGMLLPITSIIANQESEIVNHFFEVELNSPLNNVTIEMVSDLSSHRDDKIPSVLSGTTFNVRFNVTNNSDQDLRMLDLFPESNLYGTILNPSNSTKDLLNVGESWLTGEYNIEAHDNDTMVAGSSSELDLAIVLDQSGSMSDEITALTSELVDVIDAIDEIVPSLRIGLILFGGSSSNPYSNDNLVHPLTSDIQSIANILASTPASGSHEPWGDALWVAKNRLEWRPNAVRLVILITDEPCDGGVVIGSGNDGDYNGAKLYELFSQYSEEGYILCTIAASGSNSLTKEQLAAGALETEGTYIELGGSGPQTGDIPEIIGDLIVIYAVEQNFKITVHLSQLNDADEIEYIGFTFVILVDNLPPEIDHWIYLSEDFITDITYINVMCEVKDVTGVPFVEIYYKYDEAPFWTIANTTKINNTYVFSEPYDQEHNILYYKLYSKDWLNNEIFTDVQEINMDQIEEFSYIHSGQRKEVLLNPEQSVIYRLIGNPSNPAYGLVIGRGYGVSFDILAADVNTSTIILDHSDTNYQVMTIPVGHTIKISLRATETIKVVLANALLETIEFEEEITRYIGETDVFLFEADNDFIDTDYRSFLADSQVVQTAIYVFNATWDIITHGASEVSLPEEKCFILVFSDYHVGDILISFDYEYRYTPYGHYYNADAMSWPLIGLIIGLASLFTLYKKKKVVK